MKRPPYLKRYKAEPWHGVRVATGPMAWELGKRSAVPVLVLPDGDCPHSYRWPADGGPAMIYERGGHDVGRVTELASCLLEAGASSVVALLDIDGDMRLFIDPEFQYASR